MENPVFWNNCTTVEDDNVVAENERIHSVSLMVQQTPK